MAFITLSMDDSGSPGEAARRQWESQYGGEIYVLMTSRFDKQAKGQDETFLQALVNLARKYPELRFIFLGWGSHIEEFRSQIQAAGMTGQFLILPPVGKTRLIDYYRSCI
jgi:hypothetical protein